MPRKASVKAAPIELPAHGWRPRPYQQRLWDYLANGGKRAVVVWPRRHGKDYMMLNWLACCTHMRIGSYWHAFPEYGQAERAIWNETTNDQRLYMDAFPGFSSKDTVVDSANANKLLVTFKNGSNYRLVGANDPNNLVGANPKGIIFSEYAQIPVRSWTLTQPMLEANDGWAVFISTPRGKNHFHDLYQYAASPEGQKAGWFAEHLTCETCLYEENGKMRRVYTQEMIDGIRAEGQTEEEEIQQEYYCSWISPQKGSYYGAAIVKAEQEKRVTSVPIDPAVPVNTAWDLGYTDYTAIWFFQVLYGGEIHVVDYYENCQEEMLHYIRHVKSLGYDYGKHFAPWDVEQHSFQTGSTPAKIAANYGFRFSPCSQKRVDDGVESVRSILPKCWFDAKRCAKGLERLKDYRKKFNAQTNHFGTAVHDNASHGADAFRTLAWSIVSGRGGQKISRSQQRTYHRPLI